MKKIVIICYDRLYGEVLSEYLEKNGYETNLFADIKVKFSTNIKNAVAAIKNCMLIILNYGPKEDIDSLLKIFEPYKNIPIIATTQYLTIDDSYKLQIFGAHDCILEPYQLTKILESIKKTELESA